MQKWRTSPNFTGLSRDFERRHRILLLAVGAWVAVTYLVALIATFSGTTIQTDVAAVTSVAGRQRLLLALMNGQAEWKNIDALFELSQNALLNGGPTYQDLAGTIPVTLPPPQNEKIAAELRSLAEKWAGRKTNMDIPTIVRGRSLVQDMDDVVRMIVSDGETRLKRAHAVSWWFFGLALASTVVLSWLVFRRFAYMLHTITVQGQAMNAFTAPIIITDATGIENQIIYANPAFLKTYGYTIRQVLGRNPRFLHGSHRDQPGLAELRAAIAAGTNCRAEIINYSRAGAAIPVECTIAPIIDHQGVITNFIGIQLDISDRLNAQEFALKSAASDATSLAKGEVLARMSHEIRTPLAAITGFAQLIQEGRYSNTEIAKFARSIERNSHHLIAVINEILDFSKLESGRVDVTRGSVDIAQELALVEETFQMSATSKGITFSVHSDTSYPGFVQTSAIHLRQILYNLLGNALKFTPKGHVQLRASAAIVNLRWQLTFDVIDSGVGIPPAHQSRVFEPFTQAHHSNNGYGGTGLGLSISLRLAQLLGGDLVLVESSEGNGSTFRLTIDGGAITTEDT